MTAESSPSNTKIVGWALCIVSGALLFFAMQRFNSLESTLLRSVNRPDMVLYGALYGAGVLIVPGVCVLGGLRLTRLGWGLYAVLALVCGVLAWIPLVVPGLRAKPPAT